MSSFVFLLARSIEGTADLQYCSQSGRLQALDARNAPLVIAIQPTIPAAVLASL